MAKEKKETKGIKGYLNKVFIDGLSGMALGLFATLIIGTIVGPVSYTHLTLPTIRLV